MTQDDIYAAAREILKGIEDLPLDRLTIGEALFLFHRCVRSADGVPNIITGFNEDDLDELIDIAKGAIARGGPNAIH